MYGTVTRKALRFLELNHVQILSCNYEFPQIELSDFISPKSALNDLKWAFPLALLVLE